MSHFLTKEDFVKIISSKLKVIRAELDFSQDKMADVLGLSKKTLVQIEKGRILASWPVCVAVCSLFRDSEIIQAALGGDPMEVVLALSELGTMSRKEKTLGGKIWWKVEKSIGRFRLQRNIISGHYRILDDEEYRWLSSFNKEFVLDTLKKLSREFTE